MQIRSLEIRSFDPQSFVAKQHQIVITETLLLHIVAREKEKGNLKFNFLQQKLFKLNQKRTKKDKKVMHTVGINWTTKNTNSK
jgi:hypothetical protein